MKGKKKETVSKFEKKKKKKESFGVVFAGFPPVPFPFYCCLDSKRLKVDKERRDGQAVITTRPPPSSSSW
jgi:hypothetical protein